MVPKTSYLKMVDIFLIYSFNIVIVIMGVHTYMDMTIHRDQVTGIIVNTSRPSSQFWSSSVRPLSSLLLQVWPRCSPWCRSLARRRPSPPPPPECPVPRASSAACSPAARTTPSSTTPTPGPGRSTCTARWGQQCNPGNIETNYFSLQIGFLAIFFLFMIVFWSIALNNYFNEIKFYDREGNKLAFSDVAPVEMWTYRTAQQSQNWISAHQ